MNDPQKSADIVKGEGDDSSNEDENKTDERRKPEYRKPWKESTAVAPVLDTDVKIGETNTYMYHFFSPKWTEGQSRGEGAAVRVKKKSFSSDKWSHIAGVCQHNFHDIPQLYIKVQLLHASFVCYM